MVAFHAFGGDRERRCSHVDRREVDELPLADQVALVARFQRGGELVPYVDGEPPRRAMPVEVGERDGLADPDGEIGARLPLTAS